MAKDLPAAWEHLPRFTLNVRSATALMSLLSRVRRTSLAAHYTQLILERRDIQRELDLPALRVAVHNLAAAQDVDAAMAVLDMYQPPTGEDGWPLDVWHAVLDAARWSVDWDAALSVFRRMVHLPVGAETGVAPSKTKPYKWTSPNRQTSDVRGKHWVAPRPHSPTAEAMFFLVKTALAAERKGNGREALREALSIYNFYGPWYQIHNHFTGTTGKRHGEDVIDITQPDQRLRLTGSTRKQIEDRAKLAKEIVTATERLLVAPKEGEKERLERIQAQAAKVVKYWGNGGDARRGDVEGRKQSGGRR